MDEEQKSRKAEHISVKKKNERFAKKVQVLYDNKKYQECLDYIVPLGDTALRNLRIYEAKIYCLTHLKKFEGEIITLIYNINSSFFLLQYVSVIFFNCFCD